MGYDLQILGLPLDNVLVLFSGYNPCSKAASMGQRLYVLFDGKLPSKAALTRCFRELGFPLAFERGSSALEDFPGAVAGA